MTPSELQAMPSPAGLDLPLQALWWAARDEWEQAHQCAQDAAGPAADWVHAYLHRVEGDPANAAYWYRRAGRPFPAGPLEQEWEAIAAALLTGLDRPVPAS